MAEPDSPPSLASLTIAHGVLNEVFWLHREALLWRELELARNLFEMHRGLLVVHLRHEDEILLPELERHVKRKRWPSILYAGQHRKMEKFLERVARGLSELDGAAEIRARPVLELLDIEATYLHLVEHHNQAEESALYPELDAELPSDVRRRLLRQCAVEFAKARSRVRPLLANARAHLVSLAS